MRQCNVVCVPSFTFIIPAIVKKGFNSTKSLPVKVGPTKAGFSTSGTHV